MPSEDTPVPMLSPAEIARRLGVSKRTVLRWIEMGLLPAYRIGTLIRVHHEDFSTFLARHRTIPMADGSDDREK